MKPGTMKNPPRGRPASLRVNDRFIRAVSGEATYGVPPRPMASPALITLGHARLAEALRRAVLAQAFEPA